jgi:polar amino acid transport system substrate-binding protein
MGCIRRLVAIGGCKKGFLLSDPVVKTSNVYFHLKSNKFDWKTVEDLKGLRIGVTRGYDYGLEFMTALKLKKIETSVVTSDEQNFGMLLLGRIDIFPNNPIVGYSQIKNNFSPDQANLFTHHPKVFELSTLHLIISKKSKSSLLFLEKFNSGLKKLKDNGRHEQILKEINTRK